MLLFEKIIPHVKPVSHIFHNADSCISATICEASKHLHTYIKYGHVTVANSFLFV